MIGFKGEKGGDNPASKASGENPSTITIGKEHWIRESDSKWKERLDYNDSYPVSVNGVTIPIGHYWQAGKIHPEMRKSKRPRPDRGK